MELRTPRLLLRPWQIADREPFARMNADGRVMEYFAGPLSSNESDALADRLEAELAWRGWGLWAVEIPGLAPFAGFIGLSVPSFEAAFTPCVEVGWRLAARFWGAGYATEGARAAIAFGFETLNLDEIVSFTVPANVRSRHVMERVGMSHDPTHDFDHPGLPSGHPLRRHVLYTLQAPPRREEQDDDSQAS